MNRYLLTAAAITVLFLVTACFSSKVQKESEPMVQTNPATASVTTTAADECCEQDCAGGEYPNYTFESEMQEVSGNSLETVAACVADQNVAACAATASGNSCAYPATSSSEAVKKHDLSADERKIFDYLMHEITENKKGAFKGEEVEAATGVSTEGVRFDKIRSAILDELKAIDFDTSCLTGASAGNCTKFSACSVDRNLNGATSEELVRYTEEKAEDGKIFSGWRAPDFSVPTTTGNEMTLSSLRGKPVAVTFLAMHCYHSMDTLPILSKLQQKYAFEGIVFLPIFVNTTVEDVRELLKSYNIDFPFGAAPDKAISNLYNSRIVPSTFLIDSEGFVTQKYVGFQSEDGLDEVVAAFIDSKQNR